MEPIFFKSAQEFYDWLEEHHETESEVYVGVYKKHTGKRAMSWSEAVDQALCFGWIDGRVNRIDPGTAVSHGELAASAKLPIDLELLVLARELPKGDERELGAQFAHRFIGIAVTVRLPGARTAPVIRTFTGCHTGREKTGAKTPIALLKAIGKESMAVLSVEVHTWFHCRSILTQIVINGQSRAKWMEINFYIHFVSKAMA